MAKIRELLSAEKIQTRLAELGAQLKNDYAGKDLVLIGILRGSIIFLSDLCRHIDLPLEIDFLGLSSYGNRTESSGIVRMTQDLSSPIEGKDVLVVEDIVDTGLTMRYLMENLQTRRPRSVKICTFLDKPEGRKVEIEADYVAFTIPNLFVIGYGLDYAQKYRNLPYVGVLEEK
jgi:hypoxanthine phosphoribosyltransferase